MATKREIRLMNLHESATVTKGGRNVFADLGLPDADDLQFKAELTRQIYRRIKDLRLTQVEAGRRLGLQQPDVSKLMQGKFTGFSTDRLFALLTALEVDVEITLRLREPSKKNPGTVRVLAEAG